MSSSRVPAAQGALTAVIASILSVAQAATPPADDSIDELVVTASRGAGIDRSLLGASVSVLDPVDLEHRQVRIISDVLRDVPGVSVSRTGPVGGLTQVRIRGTEGNHVLMLLDGMEAADPYQGEFDFATLIADDVARVEVLRGQQSALYGSDAIGGVIHYMTASGREAPGARARLEYGSFNTVDGSLRFAGANGPLDYVVSGGLQSTDGVPNSRFGTRDLGAEFRALSGRLGYEVNDNLRLKAVGRLTSGEADANPTSFSGPTAGFPVDGTNFYKMQALHLMTRAEMDSFDNRWLNALQLQHSDAERDSYTAPGSRSGGNESSKLKASWESMLRFGVDGLAHTLTAAVDYERDEMQNTGPGLNAAQALKREVENKGFAAQYDIVFDERLSLGAAMRYDENDLFNSETTYRLQTSYKFDGGYRLWGATGTGIKNPTFFELFGFNPNTYTGNPDLKPERSNGWEAGVEKSFSDRGLVSVAYFDSKLKDEIYTAFLPGSVSTPRNRLFESIQKGIEVTGLLRLGEQWRVDASYTYLDAKENGVEEIRRPPNLGSVNISWRTPSSRAGLNLTVRYNGEMDDTFFGTTAMRVTMPAYTLVNLGADYQISDTLQFYGRVENALDEDYEEVYGFRTAGIGGYVGLRAKF